MSQMDEQSTEMPANLSWQMQLSTPPMNQRRAQTPQAVPDLEIPEKVNPPSVPPDTTANAEKPPSTEILVIPEQETERKQGTEPDQPVNKPVVTRPRRERRQPLHLKDYVLT